MSYEHNIYIKRNRDDEDSHVWVCGCRDLSHFVQRYMHSVDDEQFRYELTPFQAMKLLAAITTDFLAVQMPMWDAYEDFQSKYLYDEASDSVRADRVAMDCYAMIYAMARRVREAELRIIDNFEEPFKMERLIGGLTKLVDEMKEDDILVWTMG